MFMKLLRTLLLVDDSENDLLLLETALEQAKFECQTQRLYNGEEAIAYLAGEGFYAERDQYPIPAGVLLDLNMPHQNGFEVLSWVRTRSELQSVSFIVLTASLRMQDVERAAELGARSYLVKPASLRELTSMMEVLRGWLQINHCPPGNGWVNSS
jgi:CheY-like chemotaxis protein